MSDLISRKAAKERLEWYESEEYMHPGFIRTSHALRIIDELPSAQPEIIRCKDCRWGREVCGNIECFADSNIPPEYHGYEWYCPNGEAKMEVDE